MPECKSVFFSRGSVDVTNRIDHIAPSFHGSYVHSTVVARQLVVSRAWRAASGAVGLDPVSTNRTSDLERFLPYRPRVCVSYPTISLRICPRLPIVIVV
jgi:hypothetical protein